MEVVEMARVNSTRVGVVVMIVAACSAVTFGYGGTGPGIALKGGAMTVDSPIDGDRTTRGRIDLEICTGMLADDHFDFAFSIGGSYMGESEFEDAYTNGGVYYDDIYHDHISLIDLRLAARFYPLGSASVIRPYFGGGVGYFWLEDSWHDHYYTTFETSPGVYHTYEDRVHGEDSIADGFFPFLNVGLSIPIKHHFELLVDAQYDFDKKDSGYDLSGPIYSFGARFRF
jgi:outer membrane protein W